MSGARQRRLGSPEIRFGARRRQFRRRFPHATQTPEEPLAPGARQKAFARHGKQLRLLEPTSEFAEADWCTRAQHGYVMNGVLEIAGDLVGSG